MIQYITKLALNMFKCVELTLFYLKIMKFLFPILLFIVFVQSTFAQSKKDISVVSAHTQVQQVEREGMQVTIELEEKFVTKSWIQKMKTFGKVESDKNSYVIHGASIPDVSSSCTVYSTVFKTKSGTVIFWAIDLGSMYVTQGHEHYEKAKKKLYSYAKEIYIADVNIQIASAEGALNGSVKTQEKLVKQGESLKNSLQKNAKDKTDLERKLVDNGTEFKRLESEEIRLEGRMKEVKATENYEEQQKLLKESTSVTNGIEKNKQQKITLENKLKDNDNERAKLESDIKTNEQDQSGAKDDVNKMTKALDVVKDKLKAFQ